MKHNNNIKNTLIIIACIIVIFIILISLGNLPWLEDSNHVGYIDALLTGLSLLGAAISLFIQMRESRKIQEAEFVLNLNQMFVETGDYATVYTELEKEYFGCKKEKGDGEENKQCSCDITRIQISNYLTFFESIYLLVKKGSIKMDILNDLFSYRFFLAVHSNYVQQEKLLSQPQNFKNIFALEKMWIEYRRKRNLEIFRENNCLENSFKRAGKQDDYNRIMESIIHG